MRDFTDRVGAPRSANRFPFDQMTCVGDFFTAADAPQRSLSATISKLYAGTNGRRFASFAINGGTGTRVFLVDIDEAQSVAA